jgi:hypothetical protein
LERGRVGGIGGKGNHWGKKAWLAIRRNARKVKMAPMAVKIVPVHDQPDQSCMMMRGNESSMCELLVIEALE